MNNIIDENILTEVNERLLILGLPEIKESNLDNYLEKVVEISVKFGGKKGYLNNLNENGRADIIKLIVTNLKNIYNLYKVTPYFILFARGKGFDGLFQKIAFVDSSKHYNHEKNFLKNMEFTNLFLFCPMFKDMSKFTRNNVKFKKLSDGRIKIDDNIEKFLTKINR